MKYFITIGEHQHEVDLVQHLGELHVSVDGERLDVTYQEADRLGQVTLQEGGMSYGLSIEGDESRVGVTLAGHFYDIEIEDEREYAAHLAERVASRGGGILKAVMPGVVVEILVKPGDEVTEGQPILILEAMKMQNELIAPGPAKVGDLHVEPGQAVTAGEKLVTLTGLE